jgi:hypothetical protein
MKLIRRISLVTLLLVLLTPVYASAHGAIFTYKYIDGDNLILVTHNVHDAQANMPITYNLRLYTMGGQLIPFEQVNAQILRGKHTEDQKTVSASQYSDANFTYAYPKQGNYVLSVNFLDHDKNIAHAQFPIVVAAGLDEGFLSGAFTLQTAAALLLGIAVGILIYSQRKYVRAFPKRFMLLRKKK